MYMLEVLYAKGISNEYTQLMILGAVLILKRNSKDKIESLKQKKIDKKSNFNKGKQREKR